MRVAKFVHAFRSRFWADVDIVESEVNGQPAVIVCPNGWWFPFDEKVEVA